MTTSRKKLIEVALPLEAINAASAREKSIRHGHPSTLHLWWARRPLAAARAVIFAQMVDDPGSVPEEFPTPAAQEAERQRLFRLIEELVQWENTTNEAVLERARAEIRRSWRRACRDNAGHPRAKELFHPDQLPAFHDPFAGGGALPLEAQRLGLVAYASDLNPVAVLINKAMIEIPPKFAGRPPVNPDWRTGKAPTTNEHEWTRMANGKDATATSCSLVSIRGLEQVGREWKGAQGLAEDVRYYGKWMRDEAERRIGHLYPKVQVIREKDGTYRHATPEEIQNSESKIQNLTVIAWLWARTVKSPNPAFCDVDVPLASTFLLSTKPGKEAWVEVEIGTTKGHQFTRMDGGKEYRFVVKTAAAHGPPPPEAKNGTKLARGANFRCVMSGTPIAGDYIKAEGKAGRMGARLMAIVAEGDRGRVYLPPTPEHEAAAKQAKPEWKPEGDVPARLTGGTCVPYGFSTWGDLFTPRQLVALTTFSDLVGEAMERIRSDALAAGLGKDDTPLRDGGTGAKAYAEAVGVYLAEAVSKLTSYHCTLGVWRANMDKSGRAFGRQAIPMVWDFPECYPFAGAGGDWEGACNDAAKVISGLGHCPNGCCVQIAAQQQNWPPSQCPVISTDPPYYDNVGYADLSDFFYVWLRRSLRYVFPELFATFAVPKAEELVATPYRHGSAEKAEAFFMEGMTNAMHKLAQRAHLGFPVTIYYAFKQSESDSEMGTASTGWETFLDAVIRAGLGVSGTWPMRTEQAAALKATVNALASSIVLVCRKRPEDAPTATRREFVAALQRELPEALRHLQAGNIAPVDLAQAAIGPGMAVYTRYARVLDAQGRPLSVREALALINETLDTALAEQEGDFDADTRWALAWFEQNGFAEGEFGVAETLSKAKNTSVQGLEEAGILRQGRGKVRLLRPEELPGDWSPETDKRLTHWETVHHLIRVLGSGGETAAAALARQLGAKAETARELAYRLYTVCERKKRAAEALAYNGLVQSWPEISRLAQHSREQQTPKQGEFI